MAGKFTWALGPKPETFILIHEDEMRQHLPLVVGVVDSDDGGKTWFWRILGDEGDLGHDPAVPYPESGAPTPIQSDARLFCQSNAEARIQRLGRSSLGPNGKKPKASTREAVLTEFLQWLIYEKQYRICDENLDTEKNGQWDPISAHWVGNPVEQVLDDYLARKKKPKTGSG